MQSKIKGKGYSQTYIQEELSEEDRVFWFDFKDRKFLHNVDTFYYSVKFKEDFTSNTKNKAVKRFRRFFDMQYKKMERDNIYDSCIAVSLPELERPLNLKPFRYAGYYNICLECPDWFDIFFAPIVPHSADGGESVTCECVVQIRSYMLWIYGLKESYERSYDVVKSIADHFSLTVDFVQENRVDFCWHSNYLKNPEKFFTPEKFYKMRVDRFKGAVFHTEKVGSEDFEIDYVALGKRSDKVFIRIYLKSKEVVEKGYKPWFFKIWFYYGLINRYDLAVYEYAFEQHSWKAVDKGRLKFYLKYGSNAVLKKRCERILNGAETISPDSLRKFADSLTPKVNLVVNVEYQVMRKHSKNYCLLPFFDNCEDLTSKRIYDYFDNRKLITDYLTHSVFRLVEAEGDSNKSRRDYCAFWKALRSCRLDEVFIPDKDKKLVRDYSRKLNALVVKQRAIKSAVTYGIYQKGLNTEHPLQDCLEALCRMNDNDIEDAIRFKKKKTRKLNADEFADMVQDVCDTSSSRIQIIDEDSGEVVSHYSIRSLD